ncbi:pyridoxal phosphate-dependent aminotransferase [Zhenpiania hominis]|uniref:Aminotransferase class I/II-fold pyridoxal phosphate-dependent enzyme n=1 Tax=Zhenpiania hominis TaxID=2763644 RepID=A0A923NIY7_9FIRM|nr:aminotransferase class I/II-fold pyridoxal phosphate-dependent enzyme [Zhenpiania hominis]MBC6678765.1 aminotransferase class I/II-fold pyridoxal phosphate-dependent enzyme [Zhenpiania hominis]
MSDYILAKQNGRTIPLEDKIFGISSRAKAMIAEKGADKVINATIGSLLDDEGKLVVLSSVVDTMKTLNPVDFADYAPIGGTPQFREAVKKAAFGSFQPSCFTEAVATPGGTGAIRNTISNYSRMGDKILTSDWHWAPYNTIAGELGRCIDTYPMFDENGMFHVNAFGEKVRELIAEQKSLVIILNTPAHNPTGYSLTLEDWSGVLNVLRGEAGKAESIVLLVDAAYIDFAGDEEEYRRFLPELEKLPENILPIIAYSLSKTYTLYGTRCGAMICMAQTAEVAAEFRRVCEFSSRGSWSNSAKLAQVILSKIYADEELLKKVNEERAEYREMLIQRGRAFEEEAQKAGLEIVPFDAGFFASIPCDNPDEISRKLEKEGLFIVPLAKGLRVSVASVSEAACRKIPAMVKKAMAE